MPWQNYQGCLKCKALPSEDSDTGRSQILGRRAVVQRLVNPEQRTVSVAFTLDS